MYVCVCVCVQRERERESEYEMVPYICKTPIVILLDEKVRVIKKVITDKCL